MLSVVGVGGWAIAKSMTPAVVVKEKGPGRTETVIVEKVVEKETPRPTRLPSVQDPRKVRALEGSETTQIGDDKYYNRIVVTRGGCEAIFCLVNDPPAFYIMRDKVTNKQFRAALKDADFETLLRKYKEAAQKDDDTVEVVRREWDKGGQKGAGRTLVDVGWEKHDDFPVFRVTPTEAACFAIWLGGALPSTEEWDRADGFSKQRSSKSKFTGKLPPIGFAVNRTADGPMPVGAAFEDVNKIGVRDMNGNGKEWTRTLESGDPRTVPIETPPFSGDVLLRGVRYTSMVGSIKEIVSDRGSLGYGAVADPEIGFRVMLRKE
jgi:formylglycine-generating enzyme required for sulfatase activity